jgi:hypothetical protein
MSERDDFAVRVADGIRSKVGGKLPLIAGDASEEETASAVNNRLPAAIGIIGKAYARRDVILRRECTAPWNTRITWEEQTYRS